MIQLCDINTFFSVFFLQQSEASEMSYNSDTKQLVELERKDDVLRGSIPMTAFNFINSIIGSGIIGNKKNFSYNYIAVKLAFEYIFC